MTKHQLLLRRRVRAAVRAFREAAAHQLAEERTALDTARDLLGDAPVAIDVGANIGRWTRGFLDLYPRASVVMVEAQPELMPTLQLLADGHPSVAAVNAVLSDVEAAHDFYVCHGDKHSSGSSLRPELTGAPLERRSVTTTTVDALIDSLPLSTPVDMMKLDTQGSELDILRGAARTLESVKCLQLEISLVHYNDGGPLLAEVVAFLRDRGFFVRDLFDLKYAPDTDDLTHVDCLFSKSIRSITDLVPR
jgi:FkbM family methyltransferase